MFGKSCHLHVDLKHKASWTLKVVNLNWESTSRDRVDQFQAFEGFCLYAYESSSLYKERLTKWYNDKILHQEFRVGHVVLLFILI